MKPKPSPTILEAFEVSSSTKLRRLEGGQGTTFLAGDVVLKPAFGVEEASWVAGAYASLEQTGFRVPRPVAAMSGGWVHDGWTAWAYLEGKTLEGEKYEERLSASRAFHRALTEYPRPSFLDSREDAWSQADRIVWEDSSWQPHPRISDLYKTFEECTQPLALPEQVIHGDITGNMLYASGEPLAVIDFSPYWRPAAYADALLCVDSIMWEQAPWTILKFVTFDETFSQLMLRAVMRRLVEVDRHFHQGHLPESYLNQVVRFSEFAAQFSVYLE